MTRFELTLNDEEIEVLVELLERDLTDLSMEITNTDKMDFRDNLKKKRILLQKILRTLQQKQPSF